MCQSAFTPARVAASRRLNRLFRASGLPGQCGVYPPFGPCLSGALAFFQSDSEARAASVYLSAVSGLSVVTCPGYALHVEV